MHTSGQKPKNEISRRSMKNSRRCIAPLVILLLCCFLNATAFIAWAEDYQFDLKWGSSGSGDSQFNKPRGVAVDTAGNVYVVDGENHRVQKFTADGAFVAKWGSNGGGDGQFSYPEGGVALDSSGNVYVADTANHRIQKFNPDTTFAAKWGSYGSGDGQLSYPTGIAIDSSGSVYVIETGNHRVQKFDANGTFQAKWGSNGSSDGMFNKPRGVAVDAAGNVYVADTENNRVQKFTSGGTFVAKWGSSGGGNSQFNFPTAVAVDASGNVYVSDSMNNRVQKFSGSGTYMTKWGSNGNGDGQMIETYGVAVSSSGKVYVSDFLNNRMQRFKIGTAATTTVPAATTTVPGGSTSTIQATTSIPSVTTTITSETTSTVPGETTSTTIPGGVTTTIPTEELKADFVGTPVKGSKPLTVTFINLSTGNIVGYQWNFGDGQTGTEKDPIHTYNKTGKYSVMLTVTGADSATDVEVKQNYIQVSISCPFLTITDNLNDLETMREFRDSLFTKPYGLFLTVLYYRNTGEISSILAENPALQERFKHLVSENIGTAEELLAAGEVTIAAEKVAAVAAFLHEIQAAGSPKLQADIDILLWFIERGQLLDGLSIKIGE